MVALEPSATWGSSVQFPFLRRGSCYRFQFFTLAECSCVPRDAPVPCGFQEELSPSSFALWSSTLVCHSPGGGQRPSLLRGVSSSSLRLETATAAQLRPVRTSEQAPCRYRRDFPQALPPRKQGSQILGGQDDPALDL